MDLPLSPLDNLRQFLNANPWHFWGLSSSTLMPLTSGCNGLIRESSWQDADAISRQDMRRALVAAEDKLHSRLGFSIAPRYVEKTIPYPRPYAISNQYLAPVASDGRWIPLKVPDEGYIQAMGVETLTLIDDDVAIVYSDDDGDGIQETFTLSVATTVTDPLQIAVYFSSTERWNGDPVSEEWRIQPVRVSITAGVATIKGRRWLCVKPALYQGANNVKRTDSDGLALATASNFATTLDVYRRWTNGDGTTIATSQGVLTWETPPYPAGVWGWCCGSGTPNSTDPAAIATAIARVGIRNAEFGIVTPGEALYDTTEAAWRGQPWDGCREPDRVTLRMLSGLPLINETRSPDIGNIPSIYRDVVCLLAIAEMSAITKSCDAMTRQLHYYQQDLARTDAGNENFGAISQADLTNPFGTRRGHIMAWRQVKEDYQTTGVCVG